MQGSKRPVGEDEPVVHRVETVQDETDETFQFDADIPAMQRYIHFKATVIGKGIETKVAQDKTDG